MAKYPDEIRNLYRKKILLDIHINRLEKNETYEVAIVNRTGLGRKFVHRTLIELVDAGLLEVYDTVGSIDCYRPSANGLSMIAGMTRNERSRKYFLSKSVKFERQQPQPLSL